MSRKEELTLKIAAKEKQLHQAELELDAWSKSKNGRSNAQMSKHFVDSLRSEIDKMRAELGSPSVP